MPTVRLDIEYDGAGFRGWARQPGLRTVQGELETALATVLREPIELTVAGRTDTGVHALGQVRASRPRAEPPEDLRAASTASGPTTSRSPRPRSSPTASTPAATPRPQLPLPLLARSAPSPFERGQALWWPHRIDREALEPAPPASPAPTTSLPSPPPRPTTSLQPRLPRREWTAEDDILGFRITADAFMRNMVRVLVGTSSRSPRAPTRRGLRRAPRRRPPLRSRRHRPTHGLYLESVSYG